MAFLADDRPFPEVSRLAVVSKTWRTVSLKALKTAPHLILRGQFAESVTDGVVRLALVRVTSENLKRIDLSGCRNISASGIEEILHMIETCSNIKEVDVTACSSETVLRAVATRARAALGAPSALDLFALLRSFGGTRNIHTQEQEDDNDWPWYIFGSQTNHTRYPFSNLRSLLHASCLKSPPNLLFDAALAPRENALSQAAAHGTGSDVAMLLSLSFAPCFSLTMWGR